MKSRTHARTTASPPLQLCESSLVVAVVEIHIITDAGSLSKDILHAEFLGGFDEMGNPDIHIFCGWICQETPRDTLMVQDYNSSPVILFLLREAFGYKPCLFPETCVPLNKQCISSI